MSIDPAGNIYKDPVHFRIPWLWGIRIVNFRINSSKDIGTEIESKHIVRDAVQTMHDH